MNPKRIKLTIPTLAAGFLIAGCQAKIFLPIPPPEVSLSSPAEAFAAECTRLSLATSDATPLSAVEWSSRSGGSFYAELSDCVTGGLTQTTYTSLSGGTQVVYYRKEAVGTDTIVAAVASTGQQLEAEISVSAVVFNSGSGFDGTVSYAIGDFETDNSILVSGSFTSYNGTPVPTLVRLKRDGSIDTDFIAAMGTGPSHRVRAMALMDDGSRRVYLVGEFVSYNGVARSHIARIHPDGTLDTSFDPGAGLSQASGRVSLLPDGSNRIYVAGTATNTYRGVVGGGIFRIHPDGSLDSTFSLGSGFNDLVQNIGFAPEDPSKIYAVGNFTTFRGVSANRIVKLNSDGTADTSFNYGSGFNFLISGATGLTDGTERVCLGAFIPGGPATYNGVAYPKGFICLHADGTVDNGTVAPVFDNTIYNLALPQDGSSRLLYGAGAFTTIGGTTSGGAFALDSNGNLDTTFAVGAGFAGGTFFPLPAGDGTGKVYFFGPFTAYQGITTRGIVRLNPNGSIDR